MVVIVLILTAMGLGLIIFKNYRGFGTKLSVTDQTSTGTMSCVIYAIHEDDQHNTQFVSIDPKDLTPKPIGPLQKYEFTGLDIHPQTKKLYTTVDQSGDLYEVDPLTGKISLMGTLNYNKVSSLAFHPQDNTLWGWAEEYGLIKIVLPNTTAELIYPSTRQPRGLAWSSDGKKLYAVIEDEQDVFVYDPVEKTFTKLASNAVKNSEGLATAGGDLVLGASEIDDGKLTLYLYDTQNLTITKEVAIDTPYFKYEGLAWPYGCGVPALGD